MSDPNGPFWTLDDYRRFVRHEDYFARYWAADRIAEQFPQRQAEEFVPLLTDEDDGLQIKAAQAIMMSGHAEQYEQDLLAARENSSGLARDWITEALGRAHSQAILPTLIATLDETDVGGPAVSMYGRVHAALAALAWYPTPEAREALWRFIERYPVDDTVFTRAMAAVLEMPDAETLPRLIRRAAALPEGSMASWLGLAAMLGEPIGLRWVAEDLANAMERRPTKVSEMLEVWFAQSVPLSAGFVEAFEAAGRQGYKDLLPAIAAEFESITGERGGDWRSWLAEWRAGSQPTGYRWRMTYSGQLIETLAGAAVTQARRYHNVVAAALAALAQAALDEDDEALLASSKEPDQALLDILGSERMNVMPGVVERAAGLGAAAVPRLTTILKEGPYWAQSRAPEALAIIARSDPGSADAAVEPLLDLVNEEQSDYVLEPAVEALKAIGPAAVAPAAARFRRDGTYDIYVPSALSEIPTPVALEAVLAYTRGAAERGAIEEMDLENLGHFGRMEIMSFVREYEDDEATEVSRILYTTGLLNAYVGPEMARWGDTAREVHLGLRTRTRESSAALSPGLPAASAGQPAGGRQQRGRSSEQAKKKQRRSQAKATKKAQRKKKKKR